MSQDDDAFCREAVSCLDGLYAFAMSLARDAPAAEDLVQETYVRAFAARHKASVDESLKSWLFTILHNVWRNQLRRPRPSPLEDAPAVCLRVEEEDSLERLCREEEAERVRRAVADLPESFREVVTLRCSMGFSYRDLATILGCPAGTVMSRLSRARALLRRNLAASHERHGAA